MKTSFLKSGVIFIGLLGLTGCQTIQTTDNPTIPQEFGELFAPCTDLDGALKLQWFEEDQLLGTGELEYVVKGGKLQADVLSPVGQSLIQVKVGRKELATSGPMAQKLPEVTVGEGGFINVKGHMIPVAADEPGCLLSGKLPAGWIGFLVGVEEEKNLHKLWFDEDERSMRVLVSKDHTGRVRKYCARFWWGGFMGMFKNTMKYCHEPSSTWSSGISVLDFKLQWASLD